MDAASAGFLVVGLMLGAGIGLLTGWVQGKQKAERLSNALENERERNSERLAGMKDTFASLAAEALKTNNQGFLALAQETFTRFHEGAVNQLEMREKSIEGLVKPVKESLDKFDRQVKELETARVGAYKEVTTQVSNLVQLQRDLRAETSNLVSALKTPRVRGQWGEIQLRRVVEFAGMVARCDFIEQQTVTTDSGRLRPDMVVKLPGGGIIVVDAKTPLDQYLAAMDAEDEGSRRAHLAQYSTQIRGHISALSNKAYWDQFEATPEFVFMFLPAESFFSAALEVDPGLIEMGASQRVVLATPITLITLLKTVAYGWRREQLAEDAEKIGSLGKDLYERVSILGGHFSALGSSLRGAVDKYNEALGALESRVLVSARRFRDLAIPASDKEIKQPSQIETIPRNIQTPELKDLSELPTIPETTSHT